MRAFIRKIAVVYLRWAIEREQLRLADAEWLSVEYKRRLAISISFAPPNLVAMRIRNLHRELARATVQIERSKRRIANWSQAVEGKA